MKHAASCVSWRTYATTSALAIAAATTITIDASAHHGFGGRYDLAQPVWITGVVRQAYFGQPHAEMLVEVPADITLPQPRPDLAGAATFLDASAMVVRADIAGRLVKVELPPTQQFFSLAGRIAVGSTIAIVAVRNCDSPHQLNGQWLRLAGGEVVARAGAMSYMVKGC